MSQKSALARNLGLAALLLTGTALNNAVYAQSVEFPEAQGFSNYGLLNGDRLALYINDRGDLGSPYSLSSGAKSVSNIDQITGRPFPGNIGANGQILPTNNPPSYAALFSMVPTGNQNIGDSVRAKSEYLGAINASILEGFSVYAPNRPNPGTSFVPNTQMTVTGDFAVTGATSTGTLTATAFLSADLPFNTVDIVQTVSFQTGNVPGNRVQFSTDFTNTSGATLENFRYARVVDANTAFSNPNTQQRFLTDNEPNAFALTSVVNDRAIGIGVFGDNQAFPAQPGSILFTADTDGMLLETPFDRINNNTYVELTGNNGAVIKVKVGRDLNTSNDTIVGSTLDFINDDAFQNQVSSLLGFDDSDTSLILLSPSLTIGAGQTANFTFFYFFGGQINAPAVPEPGTIAFLVTGGLSSLWLRRRRQKRN